MSLIDRIKINQINDVYFISLLYYGVTGGQCNLDMKISKYDLLHIE
jgi:hypothetical protein